MHELNEIISWHTILQHIMLYYIIALRDGPELPGARLGLELPQRGEEDAAAQGDGPAVHGALAHHEHVAEGPGAPAVPAAAVPGPLREVRRQRRDERPGLLRHREGGPEEVLPHQQGAVGRPIIEHIAYY